MSDRSWRRADVLVRFMRTESLADAALAANLRRTLAPHERRRLPRLRLAAEWRESLAAHAPARMVVADQAGCAPARQLTEVHVAAIAVIADHGEAITLDVQEVAAA